MYKLMAGNIYLVRNGGEFLPMCEQPYDSEALLQKLLANHPALLAGEQMIDGAPRRWLLVSRELAVAADDGAASWYVDHLYVDQEGIPTLVEVKRSSDTRIRREVVGQMLDYAANAVTRWSVEQLRARLESSPDAAGRLEEFLAGEDPERFWELVGTNLAGGRVRMIFVADEIPPELRRVVDFLASQLKTAEIFAVEVRNYEGAGERALVPRLVSAPKSVQVQPSVGKQWDEQSFFEELGRRSAGDVEVARKLFIWARRHMTDFWYGRGAALGSCIPRLFIKNARLLLFAMWTSGGIEMQFQHMRISPLDQDSYRREMLDRLNRIAGLVIPADGISRRPSFPMKLISDEAAFRQFVETMEWAIEQVRTSQPAIRTAAL